MNLQQLKILKEILLSDHFNRLLLIFSILLILFASYLSDYISDLNQINTWIIGINLYRFTFLILIFSLRVSIIKLISINGYRVICYLLINHFIDKYFNYTTWSENDTITITMIIVEAIILYLKR